MAVSILSALTLSARRHASYVTSRGRDEHCARGGRRASQGLARTLSRHFSHGKRGAACGHDWGAARVFAGPQRHASQDAGGGAGAGRGAAATREAAGASSASNAAPPPATHLEGNRAGTATKRRDAGAVTGTA